MAGILRYTASNASSCQQLAAARRDGDQEQPVIIDGSAYGQSARGSSAKAHTFRNDPAGSERNAQTKQALRGDRADGQGKPNKGLKERPQPKANHCKVNKVTSKPAKAPHLMNKTLTVASSSRMAQYQGGA